MLLDGSMYDGGYLYLCSAVLKVNGLQLIKDAVYYVDGDFMGLV